MMEVMIVLGIMAIIAAVGVPAFYKAMRKEALRQAASDIVEVCSNARARAILNGTPMEVVFHPQDRNCSISGAPAAAAQDSASPPLGNDAPLEPKIPKAGSGTSASWSDRLSLEMLDVNFIDCRDYDAAHVRFFPNGTSDELVLILRSDQNEFRAITTEATTGLVSFETDIRKLERR
jgi:type II secretory pathway pseudopilin PulG